VGLTEFFSEITRINPGTLVKCNHPKAYPHVLEGNKTKKLDRLLRMLHGRASPIVIIDAPEPTFKLDDLGILLVQNAAIVVGGEGPFKAPERGPPITEYQFKFNEPSEDEDEDYDFARVFRVDGQDYEMVMNESGYSARPFSREKKAPRSRFDLMFDDDLF